MSKTAAKRRRPKSYPRTRSPLQKAELANLPGWRCERCKHAGPAGAFETRAGLICPGCMWSDHETRFAAVADFANAATTDLGLYAGVTVCRVCGCSETDCEQCIEKTGDACHWVEPDLCSACDTPNPKHKRAKPIAVCECGWPEKRKRKETARAK